MLKDKIVLVTGANRGIGKAIADKFIENGAIVYAGVRNKIDYQGKALPIILDVCDLESIKSCVKSIKNDHGKLDVLVNNAGITIIERFDMMKQTSLQDIYNVNVFGLINVTQTTMRLLRKSSAPCIINMSSIMASSSDVGQSAYASSKAAVESLTRTWSKEYVEQGFRINAIAPGNVDTDMFNILPEDKLGEAISRIGLKRLATPEEIANVALFLASDMSSYVTGEVINVNGGLVL